MGGPKRLVVPVDFSPLSKWALRAALDLARFAAAEVHLLHVIPEYEVESAFNIALPERAEIEAQADRWADRAFNRYLAGEQVSGVSLHKVVRFGKPARTICAYATEVGADWIVIASHGRSGFERAVFGSVAEKVLRLSEQPVLVIKGRQPEPTGGEAHGVPEHPGPRRSEPRE